MVLRASGGPWLPTQRSDGEKDGGEEIKAQEQHISGIVTVVGRRGKLGSNLLPSAIIA